MTVLSGEMRERGAESPRGWQEVVLINSAHGNLTYTEKLCKSFIIFSGTLAPLKETVQH